MSHPCLSFAGTWFWPLRQYGSCMWITDSWLMLFLLIKSALPNLQFKLHTEWETLKRDAFTWVFWLWIVTQKPCYHVVIRILCSVCSKGSSSQNSGTDSQLMARQTQTHPCLTFWQTKSKRFSDTMLTNIMIIPCSKISIQFEGGLSSMRHIGINSVRDAGISVLMTLCPN